VTRGVRRGLLVAAAALLALVVTVAAVGAVVGVPVSGHSMEPTLADGDRVVVRGGVAPERFDVVVLRFDDGGPAVVKRVVALAGDHVRIEPEDPVPGVWVRVGGAGEWRRVRNPAWSGRWTGRTSLAETVVPDGAVFVLGDNPDGSEDSRRLGPAPAALVLGRVAWRVWPLTDLGGLPSEVTLDG
jgi:signal peptidase I